MQSNRDRLILAALQEDIPTEDISINAIITGYTKGKAELLCKQDGIIAGLDVFARTFALLDDTTEVIFPLSGRRRRQIGRSCWPR